MTLSSDYLYHYTRDTSREENIPSRSKAIDNLVNILVQSRIVASKPHSMFPKTLKDIYNKKFNPFKQHNLEESDGLSYPEFETLFNVVSFTEVSLDFQGEFFAKSPYRRFQIEPFGISFHKQDVILSGNYFCNPCLYIYEPRGHLREDLRTTILSRLEKEYDELAPLKSELHQSSPQNNIKSFNRLLFSLFSLVRTESRESKKRHDFAFEREWRNLGDFVFQMETVESILIEKDSIPEFKQKVTIAISNQVQEGDTDEGLIEAIFEKVRAFPS